MEHTLNERIDLFISKTATVSIPDKYKHPSQSGKSIEQKIIDLINRSIYPKKNYQLALSMINMLLQPATSPWSVQLNSELWYLKGKCLLGLYNFEYAVTAVKTSMAYNIADPERKAVLQELKAIALEGIVTSPES